MKKSILIYDKPDIVRSLPLVISNYKQLLNYIVNYLNYYT